MAFQLSKTLSKKIEATKCYAKILEMRFIKEEQDIIIVNVAYYFNKQARDDNFNDYIDVKGFIVEDLTQDSRDKLYKHLKTLDEFKSSQDV